MIGSRLGVVSGIREAGRGQILWGLWASRRNLNFILAQEPLRRSQKEVVGADIPAYSIC